MSRRVRVAVLASGRGSNFKAILDHIRLGILRGVEVPLLIYSDEDAPVKRIAESYGVDAIFVKHRGVPRAEREAQIVEALEQYGVDIVAMAGYDYILSSWFIEKYRWRVLNIHPSLLPFAGGKGMYGRRVHMEVFRSGVKVSGATVHFADIAVDAGPIIDQIPVYIGDIYLLGIDRDAKVDMIADRVLVFEHRLYSRVLQMLADGLVEVVEEPVKIVRPVDDGGRIRFVEEEEVVTRAVVKADKSWFREWCSRQMVFFEYQAEEWARSGKRLEQLLGPIPIDYCPPANP